MARKFDVPVFYKSGVISTIKQARRNADRYRKDLTPSVLDLGDVNFKIARHFGFCYGVENAIEIAYKAIDENPGKKIYLLSEMIHNPHVNEDLQSRGIRFLMKTDGTQLLSFDILTKDDIVIVPAFGTTTEMFQLLNEKGIETKQYNTTCPFVEKVWNRSEQLGRKGFTVIIHGRSRHEETRATFSHAKNAAPSVVIQDMTEAQKLSKYLNGGKSKEEFYNEFEGRYSAGFDPEKDLGAIGVVNQTTMLASETHAIAEYFKDCMIKIYGEKDISSRFADTGDTLCYATSENQDALYALLESEGDIAVIVGGYNSSNTSHLVELCERKLPTYYVKDEGEIDPGQIRHLDLHSGSVTVTKDWLPGKRPLSILVSAGASCPDALVDRVITRIAELTNTAQMIQGAVQPYKNMLEEAG